MTIYLDIISKNDKERQKVIELFEKYEFEHMFSTYYKTDIRKIRKIKIAKLEGNEEFDKITKYLFDKNHVEFLKRSPYQEGSTGTTGWSGMSGTSGTSGTSGVSGRPKLNEEKELELDKEFFEKIFNKEEVTKNIEDFEEISQ